MTLLHDAYVALLSGLTTKTNNEIHWQDEDGRIITVEPIDVAKCKYIVRYYYTNGQKHWEENYHQSQLHGKSIGWYSSGQKCWEANYHQGQRHGKYIEWYESGQVWWEIDYHWEDEDGNPITVEPIDVAECKYVVRYYYNSGQISKEINYHQGQLHGKCIGWHENGQKEWERYYEHDKLIRKVL
jgi:antitoxin component YwqK of YwqJK toxin-antitoxin module